MNRSPSDAPARPAADVILAEAYAHDDEPLVLASGDGDFGAVLDGPDATAT